MQFPPKSERTFVEHIDKLILRVSWKSKETRIAKTILIKNKVGDITLPEVQAY